MGPAGLALGLMQGSAGLDFPALQWQLLAVLVFQGTFDISST